MESIDFEQVIYKWLNPQLKDLDEKLHEKTDLFVFLYHMHYAFKVF